MFKHLSGLYDGTEQTLSFQAKQNWGSVTVGPDGCAAILRGLIMLEKRGAWGHFTKGDVKSVSWGKVTLHVLVQGRGQLAGKEVGEKGPEGLGGHKVKHDPAMDPSSKEDQQHPGLH